jgi:NhaP-type Na+/H+ or K+/H+ antiporter
MNPALLLVLFMTGSLLLIGGVLGWLLGALPMPAGIAIAVIGGALESVAMLLFVKQRKAQQ